MRGPQEEFREFARANAASLHRTAYLLCGDWHRADDLVQETLVKMFRSWHRVQRADSPYAYVRRILINESNRDWHRRRSVDVPSDAGEHEPIIADRTSEIDDRRELLQALLALPSRQRATVVLRYLEGLSERETAEILQCSEGTVKSQTFRALNTLKSFLEREESRR